jgi:hypothetical protein
MREKEDSPGEKGDEILRQMREESASTKHLDQQKIRAHAALRQVVEARDEGAFVAALAALGIDPDSEIGRTHPRGFRQLSGGRY